MIQLTFALDILAGAPIPLPSLDPATVRALKQRGVHYQRTTWSAHFQEWQHHVLVCPRHEQHELVKNDEGIAALLAEQVEQ